MIEIYTKKPLEVGSIGAYIATDSLTVKDGNIILSGKGSQVDIPNYRGLIVVDGVEITNTRLKALDPNTIESINVLKGDSASKLYGEKGKNGVIEVTTIKKN